MKNRTWHLILTVVFCFLVFSQARAADVSTGVTVVVTPDAPTSLTAVPASDTQVTLSWTDNSGDLEDGFTIERKTDAAGTYSVIGKTATGVATYIDNGVSGNTTYFYRVDAFIGGVDSSYSNEASTTTPSPSAPPPISAPIGGEIGGSGVSVGGYVPPVVSASKNVTIVGLAYPSSTIVILQNGIPILQTIAAPNGVFSGSISDVPDGSYNLYLYAVDVAGRRSTPLTFPVSLTPGAITNISNVVLAPTIGIDKEVVKQGDPVIISGESVPNSLIRIEVDSSVPIIVETTSTASGAYSYAFDSRQLAPGPHLVKSVAIVAGVPSGDSVSQAFTVGNENVAAPSFTQCPAKGDLNGDCKVDLVDFSILAYWYGQPTAPAAYRLDGAPKVDLQDFSIMAYYWTG